MPLYSPRRRSPIRRRSPNKSPVRRRSPNNCKAALKNKIRINMSERHAWGWSVPQALAVSYSQVRARSPECFRRRN